MQVLKLPLIKTMGDSCHDKPTYIPSLRCDSEIWTTGLAITSQINKTRTLNWFLWFWIFFHSYSGNRFPAAGDDYLSVILLFFNQTYSPWIDLKDQHLMGQRFYHQVATLTGTNTRSYSIWDHILLCNFLGSCLLCSLGLMNC
jgi:hypothetical protein